jgi:hypothetical protein
MPLPIHLFANSSKSDQSLAKIKPQTQGVVVPIFSAKRLACQNACFPISVQKGNASHSEFSFNNLFSKPQGVYVPISLCKNEFAKGFISYKCKKAMDFNLHLSSVLQSRYLQL